VSLFQHANQKEIKKNKIISYLPISSWVTKGERNQYSRLNLSNINTDLVSYKDELWFKIYFKGNTVTIKFKDTENLKIHLVIGLFTVFFPGDISNLNVKDYGFYAWH